MKQSVSIYDTLIIGGGPAGIFAAALAHNKGLNPLLIEANEYLGGQPKLLYSQKPIYDYPVHYGIKAYQLVDLLIERLKNTPVPVKLGVQITDIKKSNNGFDVKLNDKSIIRTQTIIIATGAGIFNPNRLETAGVNHTHVHYAVEDFSKYTKRHVVVLGGGDSAVDWANEIAKCAKPKSVSIIHRREEFRTSGDNAKNLSKHKVKVYLNYSIENINKTHLVVKSNVNSKLQKVLFDEIIVQYGQSIDTNSLKIFNGININKAGRISVGINQMTNLPSIYAIGNICTYEGKPSSIVCAHGEAAVAVRHILDTIKPYAKK
ncbi:MAG: NAD(P)/FAD-dependent oxidoreductase [Mycoplasmataceae bacterium]|jgi:thioredoxin reductase (NADPH)|nr:NAD(P)/FAD-dependent oxidoreductase [Mycoplasmataceae bacterium]